MDSNNQPELIRDMALVEQPKQRLAQLGVAALRDHELLALATRARSMRSVEKVLAGTPIAELVNLELKSLTATLGMGEAAATALLATVELVRRAKKSFEPNIPVMSSLNDVVAQSVELRGLKKEHLVAFFLNARHQLIAKETISIGTLTASLAHPREIFAPAIGKAAAGVILVHNHPSGDPSPSDEDMRLTKRISQAGHIMGIDLLDHLIIAESGCYSFKQAGQL